MNKYIVKVNDIEVPVSKEVFELVECFKNELEPLQQENARLKDIFEKTKKLIEVDTYVENIYLGFCYLFGNYDFEDLPTKIKDALKKEN